MSTDGVYNLVESDDPILYQVMEDFDFDNPPIDPLDLREILYKEMEAKDGFGLAANQIGMPYRCFIARTEPAIVAFNPVITSEFEDDVIMPEGCLTYDGLFVKIRRAAKIRVRYQDEFGKTQAKIFEGITARVFQHETDHLNGIDYLSRASKFHLEQAKRKFKIRKRRLKKL